MIVFRSICQSNLHWGTEHGNHTIQWRRSLVWINGVLITTLSPHFQAWKGFGHTETQWSKFACPVQVPTSIAVTNRYEMGNTRSKLVNDGGFGRKGRGGTDSGPIFPVAKSQRLSVGRRVLFGPFYAQKRTFWNYGFLKPCQKRSYLHKHFPMNFSNRLNAFVFLSV